MAEFNCGLVWFRRDLRAADHAALYHALIRCHRVVCAFVFDEDILTPLPAHDRRVAFIHGCVISLDAELRAAGGALVVRAGEAAASIAALAGECGVQAVFVNRDYEPAAVERDRRVRQRLAAASVAMFDFKDQAVFDRAEVLSRQRTPYTMFTPYKRAWLAALDDAHVAPHVTDPHFAALAPPAAGERVPSLAALGFGEARPDAVGAPGAQAARALLDDFLDDIDEYARRRDFPALGATSRLSVHLRHGTLSVRTAARAAWDRTRLGSDGAAIWLSELIWRDFFFQILHHFPHVARDGHHAFRAMYDKLQWEEGEAAEGRFAAWCAGRTGYPLVDAAMRQLNATGFMHNRLRMVAACFLVKDLGVDWRRGEAYFAAELNDFDLSANNGNWQWAASTGCDAQPYFRIFNPVTQSEKFDAAGDFIRRHVPELAGLGARDIHAPWRARGAALQAAGIELGVHYPEPVVEHDLARDATLRRFAMARASAAAAAHDVATDDNNGD
jgi:deoxyribodipyrimidine photo-lyase